MKMANPKNLDLTENRIFTLGWGLVYRCVCAPTRWTAEEIERDVTANDPPGTMANRWVIAEPSEREDEFNGVNHLRCPDDENRTHWLMNC
jgi:hypothetical protein